MSRPAQAIMTTQEQEAVLTPGQLAKQYCGGGRALSAVPLRELFGSLTEQARSLHGRYAGQIKQPAGQARPADLLPLIQQL